MAFGYCVSLLLLAGLAAEDIRERKISAVILLAAAIGAVGYRMAQGQFLGRETLFALLPGGVLVMLSFLTGESVGYGDGVLVMVLGLWLGGWFALFTTAFGIMLSGIYGVFCLIRRKTEPIPFVPFLLLGMEVLLAYV